MELLGVITSKEVLLIILEMVRMADQQNVLDDLWEGWDNKTLEQKQHAIKSAVARMPKVLFSGTVRWVSEKWTSRNNLGDNYVLGGVHYETSASTVHCRVQKERC